MRSTKSIPARTDAYGSANAKYSKEQSEGSCSQQYIASIRARTCFLVDLVFNFAALWDLYNSVADIWTLAANWHMQWVNVSSHCHLVTVAADTQRRKVCREEEEREGRECVKSKCKTRDAKCRLQGGRAGYVYSRAPIAREYIVQVCASDSTTIRAGQTREGK